MNKEQKQEANELLDLLRFALTDLSNFSVDNDDIFNGEIGRMEEDIKNCQKQI
jgi:hypothetical protein